jgi:hypothetical protein
MPGVKQDLIKRERISTTCVKLGSCILSPILIFYVWKGEELFMTNSRSRMIAFWF